VAENLVVLTGPMRSGTTLLCNLLHGGTETGFRHPELAFAVDKVEDLRAVTNHVADQLGIKNARMNAELPTTFYSAWKERITQPEVWQAFRRNIIAHAPTPAEPTMIGVKNTNLLPELLSLSELDHVRLKVLVMVRDPRDCFASSLTRYNKMYAGDPLAEVGPYLAFMNTSVLLDYQRLASRPFELMFVQYERLVTDTEATMRSILSYIGLDAERYDWKSVQDGRVTRNSSNRPIGVDDVEVDAGVVPSIGTFKNVPEFFVACIEELMGDVFKQFGYRRALSRSFATRRRIHEQFLPELRAVAHRYGYATKGVDAAASRCAMHKYLQTAKTLRGAYDRLSGRRASPPIQVQ
jgi:hypothetical protein